MFLFCVLINKAFAITKRFVILNAERERIRNTLKKETDCHSRLHISPAGSVGASAPQRCPQDTRTAMTNRLVILNAERERIRNTLRGEMDCCTPYGICNDEGGERITAADYTASQRQKVYHRSNRFFDRLINKNRFIFLIPL